ncbi:hypothetical protein DPMN_082555 [Dreissena polymorpha]|uniref:Uncharacterized protein n=1 Tax=Dreissena polymorpha TaxID=45954 RepID=A0A9D3Y9G9_DREPO|nr:hypothetical protein DPMN_082555 [Dreissena polymorpha]
MADHQTTDPLELHLSGYNIPTESMFELRAVLMKRFCKRFSDGLSSEARQAMQQVICEDIGEPKLSSTCDSVHSFQQRKSARRNVIVSDVIETLKANAN